MNEPRFGEEPEFQEEESLPLYGIRPDGSEIRSVDELPILDPPSLVVVGEDVLFVDGWRIYFVAFSKDFMDWLKRLCANWVGPEADDETRFQVLGILDAIERSYRKMCGK